MVNVKVGALRVGCVKVKMALGKATASACAEKIWKKVKIFIPEW